MTVRGLAPLQPCTRTKQKERKPFQKRNKIQTKDHRRDGIILSSFSLFPSPRPTNSSLTSYHHLIMTSFSLSPTFSKISRKSSSTSSFLLSSPSAFKGKESTIERMESSVRGMSGRGRE